jgi:hypothetical protein
MSDTAASKPPGQVPRLAHLPPHTLRLAELVSIAVRVEPALLRAVRLRLCPDLPTAAEADLWFSGLTDARSRTGFALALSVRAALQQQLAGHRQDLERAWQVTKAVHAAAPRLMQIEEELVWLALSGAPDEDLAAPLDAVLATLRLEPDRSRGLSQWALRALPRLPARLRQLDQFWLLAFAASVRLGGRRITTGVPPASAARTWLPLLIPADAPRIAVSARLGSGTLELAEPPAAGTDVLEVPATDPIVLDVLAHATAAQGQQVILERGGQVLLDAPADEVYLRTISGEVFEVTAGELAILSYRMLSYRAQQSDFRDERLPLLPSSRRTPRLLPVEALRIAEPPQVAERLESALRRQ